jgi:hypothetical protein
VSQQIIVIETEVNSILDSHQEYQELKFSNTCSDKKQNAIKEIMNSGYGFVTAVDSILPQIYLGQTITSTGRGMTYRSKYLSETIFVEPEYGFHAVVIYGDTDSIMVLLEGLPFDKENGKKIGAMMAEIVTSYFVSPKEIQFEKIYENMVLSDRKKVYAARKIVVGVSQDVLDVKGMKFIKRGACKFEQDIMKPVLDLAVMEGNPEEAEAFFKRKLYELSAGLVPVHELVMSITLSKLIEDYPSLNPGLEIAIKYEEEENPRREGDRMEWVFVKNVAPGDKSKAAKAEDPEVAIHSRKTIDVEMYLERVFNAAAPVFGPIFGGGDELVRQRLFSGDHVSYRNKSLVPTTSPLARFGLTKKPRCVVCKAIPSRALPAGVLAFCCARCKPCRCFACGMMTEENRTICLSCSNNVERAKKTMEERNREPWKRVKQMCLQTTAVDVREKILAHARSLEECVQKCKDCVGKGNEDRIDQCGAKSCGWWRLGNHHAYALGNLYDKKTLLGSVVLEEDFPPIENVARTTRTRSEKREEEEDRGGEGERERERQANNKNGSKKSEKKEEINKKKPNKKIKRGDSPGKGKKNPPDDPKNGRLDNFFFTKPKE